jgi:hypothetical protein
LSITFKVDVLLPEENGIIKISNTAWLTTYDQETDSFNTIYPFGDSEL